MATVEVKQHEAKTLKFTFTEDSAAKDMTGATFTFMVKFVKGDSSYTVEKADASFDKTSIASGIVYVTLTISDLDLAPGTYVAEIRAYFSDSSVDLSADITFVVKEAVYDAP